MSSLRVSAASHSLFLLMCFQLPCSLSGNLKEPEQKGFFCFVLYWWLLLFFLIAIRKSQCSQLSSPASTPVAARCQQRASPTPAALSGELSGSRSLDGVLQGTLPLKGRWLGGSKGVLSPREWRRGNLLGAGNAEFRREKLHPRSHGQKQRTPISQVMHSGR